MATVQDYSKAASPVGTSRRARTPVAQVPAWSPPDVDERLKTSLGGSVVDEFVAGHDVTDVLRELVQNEFDADGTAITVTFGTHGLTVTGNGRPIEKEGWSRLSVIIGTGRTVGETDQAFIERKTNGIGSKNFGLRSLFIFGDRIYVRSRDTVAVLDLPKLATASVRDRQGRVSSGVSIHVPYRSVPFEGLLPFTPQLERQTLDVMAGGMLATLSKLALAGSRPGLQKLALRSERTGREIRWSQRATREPCKVPGVTAIARTGQLVDQIAGQAARTVRFEEIEFVRQVDIPAEDLDRPLPDYYRGGSGRIRIGVSVATKRKKLDQSRPAFHYYPLQTPHARTGCSVNISAPFELDGDRSALLPIDWNQWLAGKAADLATDLVSTDWLERFGRGGFTALRRSAPAEPGDFLAAVEEQLASKSCWPTRSASREERFVTAADIVVPEDPVLDAFLSNDRYLDTRLSSSAETTEMALSAGAKRFSLSSLVRLRCGDEGAKLQTKIPDDTANYHYTDYEASLSNPDRQARMAAAITKLYRKLSSANRVDLKSTTSTLAADGSLARAPELVLVDKAIWDACPEPLSSRLHPALAEHRAIAGMCRKFDDDKWVRDAAARAAAGTIEESERLALYRRILEHGLALSRSALAAIRPAPVVRDHRGRWKAPDNLVDVKGPAGKLLLSVLSGPSTELAGPPDLLKRLRIRSQPTGIDVVEFASAVADRPELADRFERWLHRNLSLVSGGIAKALASIPFLKSAAGTIEAPEDLYLDTPLNRLCIKDQSRLVAGSANQLYRRLRLGEVPGFDVLLATLEAARNADEPPPRPDILYAEFAAALVREKRKRSDLEEEEVIWTPEGYFRPRDLVVGAQVPRYLDVALPVVRAPDSIVRAYAALGAPQRPQEDHWEAFFTYFDETYGEDGIPSRDDRHRLLSAYRDRRFIGLPLTLDNEVRCLLSRTGRLYPLEDVGEGAFLEDDFPALARAMEASGEIAFAAIGERSRQFFRRVGVKSLSQMCGVADPTFGAETAAPPRLSTAMLDRLLAFMHRPAFARALHELASALGKGRSGGYHGSLAEIAGELAKIRRIAFFEEITQEFVVSGQQANVPGEAAVVGDTLGVVRPRNKFDLDQLVAQALANVPGMSGVAESRALATTILPLLLCSTSSDLKTYLERQGITLVNWTDDGEEGEGEAEFDFEQHPSDRSEDILRHLMEGIEMGDGPSPSPSPEPPVPSEPLVPPPPPPSPSPPAPSFELPLLSDVVLDVSQVARTTMKARQTQSSSNGAGWSLSYWTPRTPADVARDALVGRRGEELVYRMELERVRAMAHDNPEKLVVWTAAKNEGADHDIRSVDEHGNLRWLEVKSTLGTDGRFEWSRKEFEKALREGKNYELWRVYEAGSTAPTAKCFPDPTSLLSQSQLRLDIGSLKAVLEPKDA